MAKMTLLKGIHLLALLGAGFGAPAHGAEAVDVVGWPLPQLTGTAPPLATGDDPVYGRQMCPPLTRLNLAQKRSEELLLRKITVEGSSEQPVWRFSVRSGLAWWNGEEVAGKDVAAYLKDALPSVVKSRGGGLWTVPEFKAAEVGPLEATVQWSSAPAFGPFVLSGAPFYRAQKTVSGEPSFECAGLYKPQQMPWGIALVPNPGYKSRRALPEVHLYKSGSKPEARKTSERRFTVRYANAISAIPAERTPDAGSGCSRVLDLPYATMIIWNPTEGPTADKDFRRVLTQLIPRGTLVSAGAAALGEVASGPVPRQHPGYNTQVMTRPFDIVGGSAALNRLGYRRKTPGTPRLDKDGHPLKLTLAATGTSQGLAEKVIVDAFSAVGIEVLLVQETAANAADHKPVDGVLAAFALDWPRVSFLGNLHTGAATTAPFWPLGDKELDKELETYALSLTNQTPDFSALGRVHKRLAELEPMTVIFEQKACVEADSAFKLAKGVLNQRDPDWFRQLLF